MRTITTIITSVMVLSVGMNLNAQKKYSNKKINNLKNQAAQLVEEDKKMTQVMIDKHCRKPKPRGYQSSWCPLRRA